MKKMNANVKIIFHIDFNAFFCSVAEIYNPTLRNTAFAIGRENSNYGVVSTASYEARKYGIHSGMALKEAYQKLPNLIVVSLPYSYYVEYHKKFIALLKEYTDLIEVASIDEAYIDVTKYCMSRHPLVVAKEIQTRLLTTYHLSTSIGIAPNLFLAKMASDMKKPLGITVLRKRDIKEKLYPLSVKEIFGVGKKTYPRLIEKGIRTIGDFVNPENKKVVLEVMSEKYYLEVLNSLNGNSRKEINNTFSASESISSAQTYDRRLGSEDEILFELKEITKDIHDKLKKGNYYTKTVTITLRNIQFETTTRSKTILEYTDDFYVLFDLVTDLFYDNFKGETLRLIGVGFHNLILKDLVKDDYNLFTASTELSKEEQVLELIDKVNLTLGENTLYFGKDSKKSHTSKTKA